jgi:hypothetical protein
MTLTKYCFHLLVLELMVSGDSIDDGTFDMKSTLMTIKVMARYLLANEKLRKGLKLIILEDHLWHLRSSDQNSMSVVKV